MVTLVGTRGGADQPRRHGGMHAAPFLSHLRNGWAAPSKFWGYKREEEAFLGSHSIGPNWVSSLGIPLEADFFSKSNMTVDSLIKEGEPMETKAKPMRKKRRRPRSDRTDGVGKEATTQSQKLMAARRLLRGPRRGRRRR